MNPTSRNALRTWFAVLAGCAIVLALGLAELHAGGSTAIGQFSITDYQAKAEAQNRPAPDFSLPAIQGGSNVSPSSFRSHVLVINFWASWCAPCRLEAPGLRWVAEHYASRGVRLLGVDERDNDAAGRTFAREFHIPYPSASDPSGSLADDYGLFGLPMTFVIDARGLIRYRFVGYVDREILQATVDRVLSGSAP
jgi:cytochrome c biogenesis protein CcmG/thiol:disulfide interchange protein DsbE